MKCCGGGWRCIICGGGICGGIRCIIWAWDFFKVQQCSYHLLNLVFVGAAISSAGLFNLHRGIFGNF